MSWLPVAIFILLLVVVIVGPLGPTVVALALLLRVHVAVLHALGLTHAYASLRTLGFLLPTQSSLVSAVVEPVVRSTLGRR